MVEAGGGVTTPAPSRLSPTAVGVGLVALLPAAMTGYAAFQAGGFFVGTPALLAVVAGLALVARITLADEPFAGFGGAVATAAAALGVYCVWILLSASWSDAPARAMVEFDRALLYWLLLVLGGSFPRDDARTAWAMRGVALTIVGVCTVALATRLFPDAFDLAAAVADERLNYPLTYWNALGVLAGIGIALCLHLSASEREPSVVRVVGAAALPILAITLYFTFSRGGLGVAIIGVVVYLVIARPRALISAILAAGPPIALALASAYDADLLAGDRPTAAAAAAQGVDVAQVLVACVAAAAVLRVLLLPADERLRRLRVADSTRRTAGMALALAAAVVAVVALTAFDAGGKVIDRVEGFTEEGTPSETDDFRGRFTSSRNNGRIEQWEVAFAGFRERPVLGDGAGAFVHRWNRERPNDLKVVDAHSLYLETLAELGIVGGLAVLVTLATLLGGFAVRARGEHRHVYAALLAAGVAWAVHAGVDWDWEMPAVTLWLFALGGMALARTESAAGGPAPGRFMRVALATGCLALLATPALMALSQGDMNRAVTAFKDGDCGTASSAAVSAAKLVSVRPEPYVILGYCNSRAGDHELAIEMFRTAIAREPESWDSYYGLALVTAAAGRDPRRAAGTALALNPEEPLARDGVKRFRTADPRKWKRRASDARLPIQ